MNITANFTLEELTRTDTGLDNTLPDPFMPRLQMLANALEKVRIICGSKPIIVHSGYRSVAVNEAVGGTANSAHCQAYAADFEIPGLTITQVCLMIANSPVIKFDQLIDEKRGGADWVHLSVDPRMRRQLLTYRNGTYSNGLTQA